MAIHRKAQDIFADSFEQLIETRAFEDISVTDIVEHADSCRSTFYKYFHDKYEVVVWIYSRDATEAIKDVDSWNVTAVICDYLKSKSSYYKKVINYTGQNSFSEYYFQFSYNYMIRTIEHKFDGAIPKDVQFSIKHFVAGCVFLMKEWINSGMKESSKYMDDIIALNLPDILAKYLLDGR